MAPNFVEGLQRLNVEGNPMSKVGGGAHSVGYSRRYKGPKVNPLQVSVTDDCCVHREIYEEGKKAFVSFVHFYYKHECKLIFQARSKL